MREDPLVSVVRGVEGRVIQVRDESTSLRVCVVGAACRSRRDRCEATGCCRLGLSECRPQRCTELSTWVAMMIIKCNCLPMQ